MDKETKKGKEQFYDLNFDQKVILFGDTVLNTAKQVLEIDEMNFCLLLKVKDNEGKPRIALTTDIMATEAIQILRESADRMEKALAMREKENMKPENIQ